jgi:Carboxypeptidase regulatory-like domain/TonB-dependent Receptor Plug Domain
MKRRGNWFLFLPIAIAILLTGQSYGQQTTGSISGTITDASGAAVPNATIIVNSPTTGLSRTVSANNGGQYSVEELPSGGYEVTVKVANFKEAIVKGVIVQVATNATVNTELQIGSVSDTVTVEANAVQVQIESGAIGNVIDGGQVKELPLNGRSFVQLTQLQPGVSAANNFDTKNKGLQGGVDMSVNGNPTTNNLFLIDGVNNNDTGSNRTILIYPSNEAIGEFKFVTNSYGAEYGQASGGIISIVTRNGTNQFHGSAFYSGRNDALSAYTYFARQNAGKGLPLDGKDKLRRNDWGYSIGGPVLKDKLFFFWSQEWNHEIRGRTVGACVPTAAERAGDFTNLSCSGAAAPNIPAQFQAPGKPRALSAVDPSAATILQVMPLPNLSTLNSQGRNWQVSLPTALYWREENVRVDYNLSPRNAIMGRYTQDTWSNPSYNAGYWGDDPYPALDSSWAQPSKSIVGRWTATISNTFVNAVAFQYSNNRISITPGGTNPALLPEVSTAIQPLYSNSIKRSAVGVPQVNLGVYSGSGGATIQMIAPWQNQLNLYTLQDNVSKVWNRHTLKFGILFDWNGKDEDTGPASSERPIVNTADTNVASTAGGFATGNNLANFLVPRNVFNINETSTNVRAQLRWRDYEFYVVDSIKLTPRLTLEAGVRYSYMTPTFQPNNQLTNFQPSLYDPAKPASDACNGLWIVNGTDPCGTANKQFGTAFSSGVVGPNKYLVDVNNHLFAPRVGVAWDVYGDGRTALRFGAGQFFQRERVSRYTLVSNAPFALNASGIPRTLDGATPAAVQGTASPAGGYDPRDLMPNSWQWNATVEQTLAKNSVLSISYVGNRGVHLTSSYDINQVPQQNWLAASFASGSAVNAFRPYSKYGTLTWWAHDGNSNYNGLQVMLRSRLKNLQFTAAYTWSHSIADIVLDDSGGGLGTQTRTYFPDPGLDRGNGDTNRPNVFVANAIYYLPQLKGSSRLVQGTLGGWELSGITTAASGNSFTIYQSTSLSENTANLASQPLPGRTLSSVTQTGFINPLRPLTTGASCTANQNGSQIVNPNAFTMVGYVIGTIPANTEPRGFCGGPRFVNTDFSVNKNWKIFKERATIQFRMDFFDIFNHANFNASNGSFSPFSQVNCGARTAGGYAPCSPTNNVVTSAPIQGGFGNSGATIGNAARQLQYGLHIDF